MKKSTRRRPELESLESVMLLSTMTIHAAKAPAQVAPVTLALAGTIQGNGQLKGNRLTVDGSGKLSPVGSTTLHYKTRIDNPSLSVTLGTRHGKLILVGDSPIATESSSGSTHYRIIGGTGSYVRANGSGTASVTLGATHGNRTSLALNFS